MMGHNSRQFIQQLESGYYEKDNMSNPMTPKAEFDEEVRRKQRGLLADQFNLDCSRNPPLPTIDYSAARYERKPDNGDRNRRSDKPAEKVSDPVNQPAHYTGHPSGVECITITEHMDFLIGNTVKYLWRAGLKGADTKLQDMQKAKWYLERAIAKEAANAKAD